MLLCLVSLLEKPSFPVVLNLKPHQDDLSRKSPQDVLNPKSLQGDLSYKSPQDVLNLKSLRAT